MALLEEKDGVQTFHTIALRGIVIFPGITTSFELGRKLSVASLKQAAEEGQPVFLAVQKDAASEEPEEQDLLRVGVVAKVVNVLRLTNGNYQIMTEGMYRAERLATYREADSLKSEVRAFEPVRHSPGREKKALDTLWRVFSDYLRYVSQPSPEILEEIRKVEDVGLLTDFLASNFLSSFEERRTILETLDPLRRAEQLCSILERDIALLELESSIQSKVKYRLQRRQRDAYLREQLNTIRSELGMDEDAEEMVFRHELMHYRHGDLLIKWFMMFVNAAHWFNPLAYLLTANISEACEVACDMAVIDGMDDAHRRIYMETILNMLEKGR